MAVKIKLARLGKIREPFYRVVVADARTRRSGRAIESIGKYHPKSDPSVIEINSDRVQYWLSVGAQPTESVLSLLKVTGDWQKFKGLPGAEGTLQGQKAKPDKKALYESALSAAGGADGPSATTPRRRGGSAERAERPAEKPAEKTAEKPRRGRPRPPRPPRPPRSRLPPRPRNRRPTRRERPGGRPRAPGAGHRRTR